MYDVHTLVDIATLLLAVGGGLAASYRSFADRLRKLEEQTATHEGALKAAKLL